MRKIVILSYGMSDTIIPTLKNLSKQLINIKIDLILVYSQSKKKEGIINFNQLKLKNGFGANKNVNKILKDELINYIEDRFKVNIFIYKNLKFKSLKNIALSFQLIQFIRNYDIIHINGIDGTFLHLLPFLKFKKWVATIHDFEPHSGEGHYRLSYLQSTIANNANRIIIQNKNDLEKIKQNYPKLFKKTTFIPFGYLSVYKSFLKEENNVNLQSDVLFFGRISKYKGLEYLLEATKILNRRGKHPKIIVAGSGNYDFGLSKLNEFKKVVFINRFIENELLVSLIHNTKIVVCPYTDASQSGVLMTSFAFNKPVIATKVGGFADVVIDEVNGLLIPPKDSESLADAIDKLLQDKKLLEKLHYNIQNRIGLEEFDWENIAKKYNDIYQQLLKN